MTFDEARLPEGTVTQTSTARLSVIDASAAGTRPCCPAGVPGLDSAVTRRRMLETLAIIDAAATSLSSPFLTPADLAAALSAHEAAAGCLTSRDVPGLARQSAALHQLLSSRCPNRHLLELLTEELVLVQAVSEPEAPNWRSLAGAVEEHAQLLRLVQASPGSHRIGRLLRTHRQSCY